MIGIGSVACQLDTFPVLARVEHGPFRDRYGADLDRVTGAIIRVAGERGPRRDVDVKVSAAHPEIRVKRVHGVLAQPVGSHLAGGNCVVLREDVVGDGKRHRVRAGDRRRLAQEPLLEVCPSVSPFRLEHPIQQA